MRSYYRKNDIIKEFNFEKVVDSYYQSNNNKNMNSDFLTLNWKEVGSAVLSSILSAVLVYLSNLTSFTNFDWQQVLGIAVVVGASSLLKAFGTTSEGLFLGAIKIK